MAVNLKPDSDSMPDKPAHPKSEHVDLPSEGESKNNSPPEMILDNVSYGPGGIRGIFASPYVFGAAFLASLGGFSFGYDQGVISIINVMDQFHNTFPRTDTPFGTSFMTGMLLLGAFVGCIFMPYLADKVSRKWALTVVVVIFNFGAILQTAATSYGMLVAGRAIGGIGVGTLAMVCRHTELTAQILTLARLGRALRCTFLKSRPPTSVELSSSSSPSLSFPE